MRKIVGAKRDVIRRERGVLIGHPALWCILKSHDDLLFSHDN
jgi:hypothetical protein